MSSKDPETIVTNNGELLFVAENHEGKPQLYDFARNGPKTTNELRDEINNVCLSWGDQLARDHLELGDFPATDTQLKEFLDNTLSSMENLKPWQHKARECIRSGYAAIMFIDKGDFQSALNHVWSHVHLAQSANWDKQQLIAMREESRIEKSEKETKAKAEEKFYKQKKCAEEAVEDILLPRIQSGQQLPNKTELDNHIKDKSRQRVPNRERLKKITAKKLEDMGLELPRKRSGSL